MLKKYFVILCVLSVIALFIVPIPGEVLDLLIACNIVVSLLMLFRSLTTVSLVGFSSFPTLLLIATMFRLALTISSTRLILADGDAGEVIMTFGTYVTKGSLVVGVAIFLVITLVNFIVITKGSERIGEVSSRFFLDSLPGKQISIDNDLKSGLLTTEEAQEKRRFLDLEAQMFGSLDGTMKFVKGDAIAGIFIILINITGGMITGTKILSLSVEDTVALFTTLTIGDGLVAQLPSLILSVSAGVLVTRVMDNGQLTGSLESQIVGQLFEGRSAMLFVSGASLIIGLIPGMPFLHFLSLSVVALTLTMFKQKERGKNLVSSTVLTSEYAVVLPQSLNKRSFDRKLVEAIKNECFASVGISPVDIHVCFHDGEDLQLYFNGKLSHHRLIMDSNLRIKAASLNCTDNQYGNEVIYAFEGTSIVRNEKSIENGSKSNVFFDIASLWCRGRVTEHVKVNFSVQETKSVLDYVKIRNPQLIYEITEDLKLSQINEIFRRLLSENVSLVNAKDICTALYSWCGKENDEMLLVELVRIEIRDILMASYVDYEKINYFTLTKELESQVAEAIEIDATGSYVNISNDGARQLVEAYKKGLEPGILTIIVTKAEIRRHFWSLMNRFSDERDIRVHSYNEIGDHFELVQVGVLNEIGE